MDSAVQTFDQYRPYMFSIAYRMMGTVMDAEDIVQESYLRWRGEEHEVIRSPRAFLATIVTRLCLDRLRSAQAQREIYPGTWLPEPIIGRPQWAEGPLERRDTLSIAFLFLMEQLNPIQRAVFVLREAFDYSYAEIAEIVDKSESNCRQILRRARQQVGDSSSMPVTEAGAAEEIARQFAEACFSGDEAGVMAVLADDVVEYSDGGGVVRAALRPVFGVEKVTRFVLSLVRKLPDGVEAKAAPVNGQPGYIFYAGDQVLSVSALEIAGGRIRNIYTVVNPEKLGHISSGQFLAIIGE